jgi:hypothetical protein
MRIREIKVLIFNIPVTKELGNIGFIEVKSAGLTRTRYDSPNMKRSDWWSCYTGYFSVGSRWRYCYLFVFEVYCLRAV